MLGSAPPAPPPRPRAVVRSRWRCATLSLPRASGSASRCEAIDLTLRAGEIVGVAGISGNGQAELLAALSGEDPRARAGAIHLFGQDVSARAAARPPRPRALLRAGGADRARLGAEPVARGQHAADAARAGLAPRLVARAGSRGGWRRASSSGSRCARPGPEATAGSLSGGNLQKFIVGREVDAGPSVLIVAQPTWGLDVGAAAADPARAGRAARTRARRSWWSARTSRSCSRCATDLVVIARGRLSPRVSIGEARHRARSASGWAASSRPRRWPPTPARRAARWRGAARVFRLAPRTPPRRARRWPRPSSRSG